MIDVAAAIIERDGRVLAARRRPGIHLAGCWEFPGGKVEPGETPQACLVRELQEELGVQAQIGAFVGESVYDYGGKVVRLLAYRVGQVAGELHPVDHDALRWLLPDELPTLPWAPADVPLVEQYRARIGTERYYEANAGDYFTETMGWDMSALYRPLLQRVPPGGHILDLGCGSGRDSKAFLQRGYRVTALDASAAMAALAEAYIGQPVLVMSFQELDAVAEYDAVWACASLLHCPAAQMGDVLGRVVRALKPGGAGLVSLKWGQGDAVDDKGRYFHYYREADLQRLLQGVAGIAATELWQTVTPLRGTQQRWLNALLVKEGMAA